jgi:hypothetical protein
LTERSFAHVCETGGARRCWLRGLAKVAKRYLLQVAARNLGQIMRKLFGMGTPRGLQPQGNSTLSAYLAHALLATLWIVFWRSTSVLQTRALFAPEKPTAIAASCDRRLKKLIFNRLLCLPD